VTVYFVCPAGNPGMVKIGHTIDLERRLTALAGAHDGGIELLAQCEGSAETEAAFHGMFIADRVEGEWFARSPLLTSVIDKFSHQVTGRRVFGPRRPVLVDDGKSPLDVDRSIAKRLLTDLLSAERAGTSLAAAHERAFQKLYDVNGLWTRRRIRAIWDGETKRIDFYEIRDLAAATNKAADWAEWICPEIGED
jgi:hypothetical protein